MAWVGAPPKTDTGKGNDVSRDPFRIAFDDRREVLKLLLQYAIDKADDEDEYDDEDDEIYDAEYDDEDDE